MKVSEPNTLIAGLLLGAATGLLVGLARSPVVGAVVTGLMAAVSLLASAPLSQKAPSSPIRWRRTTDFLSSFALALLLAVIVVVSFRLREPSHAQQLARILSDLKIPPGEIANTLTSALSKDSTLLDEKGLLYNSGAPVSPVGVVAALPEPSREQCDKLRPPNGRYNDPTFITQFKAAGGRFAEVADFVETQIPASEAHPDNRPVEMLMLLAGYHVLCVVR
jgi:hypothetical protein